MEYIYATSENLEEIYQLVRDTVTSIYPKYYPQEVVDFFCKLHSKENILKDIESGLVGMLVDNGQLVGTGSYNENHITRVYVSPKYQGQGYGSFIMQTLEDKIALTYTDAFLDASLPACHMYEKRGYVTQKHEKWDVENGVVLVYEIMRKELSAANRFFEEISSNAHVALNTMQYDGWLIRFANGYTNRANSVSVIYPSTINFDVKVPYCEEIYKKANLPCVFKLTQDDNELNKYLEARGYEVVTPTDVMILDLKDKAFQKGACIFSKEPTEEWLRAFFAFEGFADIAKQETFCQMFSKVLVDTIYCSVIKGGEVIACASAAMEHGYMLLQNVVVSPEYRGRGYGQVVCESLIAQAKENGAHHTYLQVVRENVAAVNMYLKLGYEKVYTYWYMKK